MIARRLVLLAAMASGAVAAGCGASHPQAGAVQVERTVHAALVDLAAGRGGSFCALATHAERARLARAFARHSCAAAMGAVGAGLSPYHRRALLHARVERVTVKGARASVRASAITTTAGSLKGFLNDHGTPTTLVRQADGSWLIDG